MRPSPPRRPWTWTCAACLAALAGALFWPASDIPRLAPAADRQPPPSVAASATPGGEASPPGKEDARPSGTAPPGAPPQIPDARDAVADGPWRLAAVRGDWSQAPWQAHWGVTPRETAFVPVPQALPRVYRRAAGSRSRAMPPPSGLASSPAHGGTDASAGRRWAKVPLRAPSPGAGPGPGSAAEVSAHEPPRPGKTPTPKSVLSRMRGLLRRMLAYRARTADIRSRASRLSRGPAGVFGTDAAEARSRSRIPARSRPAGLPRWRPVRLSQALGTRAIRPPTLKGQVPDLSRLARLFPETGPDGKPLRWRPASAAALEGLKPPEAEAASCRRTARHWHPGPPAFHTGKAWAVGRPNGWVWLQQSGKRWWAWTGPDQPTWLWHKERWWWRSQGIWFMLHQGEAWGYRLFSERGGEGLVHPGTGTRMEYSADGGRAALITPGDGAWLFDARSGALLRRWTEEQTPRSPKPRAPSTLSFPR